MAPFGLALGLALSADAQYNPVPLTPGSFTQDIVIEKGAPPPLENFANCTLDSGTNDLGNTFFEQGFIRAIPTAGLPAAGSTFTSAADSVHQFKMPPTYVTNNAAFVGAANIPGTSTLVTQAVNSAFIVVSPGAYQVLSILWASGGSGLVDVTITHQDGSTESSQISTIDWFNSAGNFAYSAQGRVALDGTGSLNNIGNAGVTKLFSTDVYLNNTTSPVTKVAFAYNGTGASANYRFFAFALSGSANGGASFAPIDVSGFNCDAVVEASAEFRAYYVQGYTVTLDSGPNGTGDTFYEQGFCTDVGSTPLNRGGQGSTGTTGLPHPGATITSGNYTFQMPATYAGNDCVFIGSYPAGSVTNGNISSPDYTTGSFTINNPQHYSGFSVLCSAGNGPCVINYTVNYSDGNIDQGQISVPDWFSSSPAPIFNCAGRVHVDAPGIDNLNGSPAAAALYNADIASSFPNSSATNISFSYTSGGRAALFALSGSTSGGAYSPIAVSGYNADAIVEKEQPFFHGGLFTATTATMDLGTNNGNYTWFEQGWVTNGVGAASGLPPAGSLLTSMQSSSRKYQMPASYAGPNAVLIDTNHQVANITPTAFKSYSAFALLTAGASIGAGNTMTNLCILQHADGIDETNVFYGKDWFDTTVPPAFISNGRGDTRSGVAGNVSGAGATQNPRLFETFFQLTDTTSPVTNIVVQYKSANGANWTTYVLAVSATAGAVQPFIGEISLTPGALMYEGSNLVLSASVGGTAPITYQWQFSPDGTTWNSLTDAGTVSGAATPSLDISSVGWTNSGQYRLVASNVAGSVTNTPLSVTVYSVLPDVTVPTDPVLAYQPNGGGSPVGSEAIHAIDRQVGTNATYINYGQNQGASPFVGPVGFVVTPASGRTTITAVRLYPADVQNDDPINWTLEGSNNGGTTWARITTNSFSLPAARNSGANTGLNPLGQPVLELHFPNATGYTSYRVSFWNTFNDAAATDTRIGEVELLGTNTFSLPLITQQPVDRTVWQGGNPTFTILATGAPLPFTYQWYRGGTLIPGATQSAYTLVSAQSTDNGATFSCTVSDGQGATPSTAATLHVIAGAPTVVYPKAIMADQPLAFWRLDEGPDDGMGNNGKTAYDYFGGFNGTYSNTVLQLPGYNPNLDPDTAAGFGSLIPADSYVGNIKGIDFATPTNSAGAFSVEAWVLGGATLLTSDAGIVTKGYGGGGEQFDLDCGSGDPSHYFRFFVRDAATGSAYGAAGSVGPTNLAGPFPSADGYTPSWHYVVGVCDQAHSNVTLYVDGISNASIAIPPTSGILKSPWDVSIGSRTASLYGDYTNQFIGTIDEVALYNYALSSTQILNHYFAAHPLPVVSLQPPPAVDASQNGMLTLAASAYGAPPLTFQWYQSTDGGASYTAASGQTSANYTNTATPGNLTTLYLVATDPYGSATSSVVNVTVHGGVPVILTDLVPTNLVYASGTVQLKVTAYGTAPLTFQWSKSVDNVSYVPLADSAHIVGSQSNALSILGASSADNAYYRVTVSNGSGSVDSVHEYLIVQARPNFNGNGLGWHLNGDTVNGGPSIVNDVFTMTDGTGGENRSAWYQSPLYIGAFQASFVYQDIGGGGADGSTFCLQNDSRGVTALGGGGGGLGYSGITPSAALEMNIYNGHTIGLTLGTNGNIGTFTTTPPVNIASGDPIAITLQYDGMTLSVNLKDTTTSGSFSTSFDVDLPSVLGADTAYVGITGTEGGILSHQIVSNLVFTPLPVLSAQAAAANQVVLSWSGLIGGYVLQSKANLSDPNPAAWVNVNAPVSVVNGLNQVTLPATAANYYRLVLPASAQ